MIRIKFISTKMKLYAKMPGKVLTATKKKDSFYQTMTNTQQEFPQQ